jgi:thiosulfate/3-mercaptopyruvate sulfurtransferase
MKLSLALVAAAVVSSPADEPLVVTTSWLSQHLNDQNLIVFHIGEKPTYDSVHIPGARYLTPFTDLSTPRVDGQLFLELPSRAMLDSVLSAKGVSNESRIVLYASNSWATPTSRTLFTLEYVGLRGRVSILDGGLDAWRAEGRPVTRDVPVATPTKFVSRPDSSIVVDAGFVSGHLSDAKVRIVDARDTAFYNGRETRQGRNGHIPGAVSLPFSTMVDSSGHFRPVQLLRTQFTQAGVKDGQTVVTYCHIGQQASLVWFAARLLGYQAKLYDGSFQDWAKRTELPVEGERKP